MIAKTEPTCLESVDLLLSDTENAIQFIQTSRHPSYVFPFQLNIIQELYGLHKKPNSNSISETFLIEERCCAS
jgi:hypothetical protein